MPSPKVRSVQHRRRINTEQQARVVAAVWGTELIQFLATLAILHKDDLKKRMNRKIDDHPVHTTPNHHPPKKDVLPKNFLQIILSAIWLEQH